MRALATRIYRDRFFWPLVLAILVLGASLQSLWAPLSNLGHTNYHYTAYNNYVIFRQSFAHLLHDQSLYVHYPEEHWDLFKYSPTFALAFGVLAILPDGIGLVLWNLLNAWVWWKGIRVWQQNPSANPPSGTGWWLGIGALELLTSLQNEQSNALITGLLMWAWGEWERGASSRAIGMIMITGFIKLFGWAALLLWLAYPNKGRNFLLGLGWGLLLAALPLAVISPSDYLWQIQEYLRMLDQDHSLSHGISLMGFLDRTMPGLWNKNFVLLFGLGIMIAPWLVTIRRNTTAEHRALGLAALMVWMVIFNHKAESPTFVIAVTPALWWILSHPEKPPLRWMLGALFLLTILSPTDLFPATLRKAWIEPYHLKALPCVIVWIAMQWELYRQLLQSREPSPEAGEPSPGAAGQAD
jgi:hypothetical protein